MACPGLAGRLAGLLVEKNRWSCFFEIDRGGRCAVDLRRECVVSRIACIYVGARAATASKVRRVPISSSSRVRGSDCSPCAIQNEDDRARTYLAPRRYIYIHMGIARRRGEAPEEKETIYDQENDVTNRRRLRPVARRPEQETEMRQRRRRGARAPSE